MRRATSPWSRVALTGLGVLLIFASSTARAAVNTFPDLKSFLAAAGSSQLSYENLDSFQSGTLISDQIPGVVFSSPNQGLTGFLDIQAVDDPGAASPPNVLNGGSVPGSPRPLQTMALNFSPSITAFAFDLCDYLPGATAASVRLDFADGTSATLFVSNTTTSELTPVFFGAITDTPIVGVLITSGVDQGGGYEEYTIDDLRFGTVLADTNPPICVATPVNENGALGINGQASDIREGDSGIQSVALQEGEVNLLLMVDPVFQSGDRTVRFRVVQFDASRDGRGTVVVTDRGGNSCTVPATFRTLGPGPLTDETICTGEGFLLSVSNDNATLAGTSACSANLPNATEPQLPPGYEPSPPDDPFPCQVLTIESPVEGLTHMILKKDGVFDARLRLMFSESQDNGLTFPPFNDVTEFVEPIDSISPDPTRIGDSVIWTPVKVSCALQSETARLSFCAGLPAGDTGPDFDGDAFTLCGSATSPPDCNDQRSFIHPGAEEICNGLDDNCNGTIDEGHPTQGADLPCTIPGLLGACAHGATSCADGPRVCKQTVFPIDEIACNGVDDDCDGKVDELYTFSGFLPPIKPDGSVAFLRKRGAIPVAFQLTNCSGQFITNAVATIEVLFVKSGAGGDVVLDVSSVGGANAGNLFRFNPDTNQYIYNLDALMLASNSTYKIRAHLDDGTTHEVLISIK
ncbi:MAG TPA: MopE-related protein [Candidatus Dormibacteraeota bacterium]|nr:MopE-related protein [Candidatus Dormibacteraeota bacterium]